MGRHGTSEGGLTHPWPLAEPSPRFLRPISMMAAVRFGSVRFAPEPVPVHPVRFGSALELLMFFFPPRSSLPSQHAPVPVRPVPVRNGSGSPVPVRFAAIMHEGRSSMRGVIKILMRQTSPHRIWAAVSDVDTRHFDIGFWSEIGLDFIPRSSRSGFWEISTRRIDPRGSRGPKRASGGRKPPERRKPTENLPENQPENPGSGSGSALEIRHSDVENRSPACQAPTASF